MIDPDIYRLSKYLLHSLEEEQRALPTNVIYSNESLLLEISETIKKLKGFHDPGLTVFRHYQHVEEKGVNIRHFKSEMLEEDQVYDKFILTLLKEFCLIAVALLVALDKLHKKQIFSGNLTPYDFVYNKRRKKCEANDPDANLATKKIINIEKQQHGDLVSFQTDLFVIKDNKYLAPELKQSMHVFNLQKKLKNLIYMAEDRGLKIQQVEEVRRLLSDFHQKHVKYTNKAEIYSIGYSLNEILSHSLEKLAKLKLSIHEFPAGPVDDELVKEADALLPDKFDNHGTERVIDLLNEAVEYIHDLMKEQADNRDSLPESIAKFRSILARIKAKAPTGSVLEREEEESEEHDELMEDQLDEEYEEYEDEEQEEHEEHEAHAHAGGGDHQHEQHEEHAAHDHHEEHEHEAHEHAEHEHEEHDAHEHADHEHAEHEEHDQHEEHKHEEHDQHEAHEEHKHDEHEAHEEHKHEEHEAHEEHEEHAHAAHEEHEHEHEAHEEHEQHAHEAHEKHEKHEEHKHEEHESHANHSGGGGSHGDDHHDEDDHSSMRNSPGSHH